MNEPLDGRPLAAQKLEKLLRALEDPEVKALVDGLETRKQSCLMEAIDTTFDGVHSIVEHFIKIGELRSLHMTQVIINQRIQELQQEVTEGASKEQNPTESEPEVP